MLVKIPRKKQLLQYEEERGCLGRAGAIGSLLLPNDFCVHGELCVPWLCVSHGMMHPLHFPKCSCTQPGCGVQNTVMRACVFLCVPAGGLASPMESLQL